MTICELRAARAQTQKTGFPSLASSFATDYNKFTRRCRVVAQSARRSAASYFGWRVSCGAQVAGKDGGGVFWAAFKGVRVDLFKGASEESVKISIVF